MDDTWKKKLQKRLQQRQTYFDEVNPDTVRKILIEDFKTFLQGVKDEEIEQLVQWAYHPWGQPSLSYGNNVYFKTLLAIADQLFIYQEFLSEMAQEIQSIVPIKIRMAELSSKTEKAYLHLELHETIDIQEKLLRESPNKKAIFDLINGRRSLTDIWEVFNETNRTKETRVSKQYISQVIKELEQANLIEVERKGKAKIPRR